MNDSFITQLKTFSDGSTAYYEDAGETIKVIYPHTNLSKDCHMNL